MAPLIHMWMHENVSWEEESSDHHYQPALITFAGPSEETIFTWILSSFVSPEQDPKILQDIKRGNFIFIHLSPESALTMERWWNMLESEIYKESLISVAVDEVHCVTEWDNSGNNKNRSAFHVWYSHDSHKFNYLYHINARRFTSSVWNSWR